MVRPGVTYLITRRCSQRTFRLRPSEQTNHILRFCLALAAMKTGVQIHAAVFMSNHHHIVLTDVNGNLPDFLRELHRQIAKAINASQGQKENLWSSEKAHALELGDEEEIIAKLAYVWTNPVEAGLVATPDEWPGVLLAPVESETVSFVSRPTAYFGATSSAPERVELRVHPLEWIENLLDRVRSAVTGALANIAATLRAAGRRFLGRAAVLATSFVQRAQSLEHMWQRIPTVSARRPEVLAQMLTARREFLRSYHDALQRWRAGDETAVFPFGTWWMRVFWSAPTAAGERIEWPSASTSRSLESCSAE